MRFALASQCHPHASVDAIRAISRCVGLGHRVSFEIVKPNHSAAILSHGDLLLSFVLFPPFLSLGMSNKMPQKDLASQANAETISG